MRDLVNRYAVLWINTLAMTSLAGWWATDPYPQAPGSGVIVVSVIVLGVGAMGTVVAEGERRRALKEVPHA